MLDIHCDGAHIEVVGALDAVGAPRFLTALDQISGDVEVDCSSLDRVDGAGLSALIAARATCRRRGRRLVLMHLQPVALEGLRARNEIPRIFECVQGSDAGLERDDQERTDESAAPSQRVEPDRSGARRRFRFARQLRAQRSSSDHRR